MPLLPPEELLDEDPDEELDELLEAPPEDELDEELLAAPLEEDDAPELPEDELPEEAAPLEFFEQAEANRTTARVAAR